MTDDTLYLIHPYNLRLLKIYYHGDILVMEQYFPLFAKWYCTFYDSDALKVKAVLDGIEKSQKLTKEEAFRYILCS